MVVLAFSTGMADSEDYSLTPIMVVPCMHELSVSPKLIGVAWIMQCNHSIYALGGLERICSQS